MSENKEAQSENEMAKSVVSGAFRFPRRGVGEQLISQHLFQATFSHDNPVVIKHLVRAALLCAAMTEKDNPDDFDVELLEQIFQINGAFINATSRKIDQFTIMLQIPWGFKFSKDVFNICIKPWHVSASYFPNYIRQHRQPAWKLKHHHWGYSECDQVLAIVRKDKVEETLEKILATYETCPGCHRRLARDGIDKEETTIVVEFPEWSFFFEQTQCLSEHGFNQLRTAFEGWVIEYLEKVRFKICQHVDPQTYRDVMEMFMTTEKKETNQE